MRLWVNQTCIVAMVVLAAGVARPQSQAAIYEIAGISVEGNRTVDTRSVLAYGGLRTGDRFSPLDEKIQGAVRRLSDQHLFSRVSIVASNVIGSSVYLTIRVVENPRVKDFEIVGNDELSSSDIKKKLGIYGGDPVGPAALFKIKRDIEKQYAEDGYLRARVTPTLVPADSANSRVTVRVDVVEGPSVKIGTITFVNNIAFEEEKLKDQFDDTKEKSWWQFWRSSKFDRKKYADDKKRVVEFYHREGHLDVRITSDSVYYSADSQHVHVRIVLEEGKRFYLRNVSFVGNTAYPAEELMKRILMTKGSVYNTEKFEKNLKGNDDQTDVASLYLDNGYLACQIDKDETRVGADSVDVMVHIAERNQYRVREVLVAGNTKTFDKVIRRELYTLPGDYFSRAAIIRSLRQLSVLNFFNPEKLRPDTRMVDNTRVDLVYHVEERSSDTFNASVGYSGSFGVTASIGLTFNNFSLGTLFSDPFRYGSGQVLNFVYEHGSASTLNTFTVGFTEPWLWDTPTSVGFTLFDTRQVYTNYSATRYGLSMSVGRRFRWPDDFFRGDWTLQAQRNDVTVSNGYYRAGLTNQVAITQVFSRSSIDNGIFPTSGSRVAWLIEAAIPIDSTFIGFHKNRFTFEFYSPLLRIGGQNRLVLYTIADIGYMKEFKAGNVVNLIDFFFMGGNGLTGIPTIPLRGYPDQAVGPVDGLGRALGGRVAAKYGMEIRFGVSLDPVPIYLLAFAEAGSVWSDLNAVNPTGLKRGAGIGARILINPIGMLGFDEGYGFDPAFLGGGPSAWNFHFQFGRGF
jgi:outer membrane protein insertion porin family